MTWLLPVHMLDLGRQLTDKVELHIDSGRKRGEKGERGGKRGWEVGVENA